MGRTRRSLTKEFKREEVRLITAGGQSIVQVARGLSLNVWTHLKRAIRR